jgi:hypothetical protein
MEVRRPQESLPPIHKPLRTQEGVNAMAKLDLKKELRHLYEPSAREVSVVDVPEMKYLMIDGIGDPNTAHGMPRSI